MKKSGFRLPPAARGFSIIELVVVFSVLAIILAIALPQVITARRLYRSMALSREITAELRRTRQLAMSQRQVFRFRYDNVNKEIVIIDNQERGTTADFLANDPNDDRVIRTFPLASAGIPAGDLIYGRPSGAPTTLPDGTLLTALTNNRVEVIFQPDGSVLDTNGNPTSTALFFHNRLEPDDSAIAVSVLGAGGRIKSWRYSKNANLYVN